MSGIIGASAAETIHAALPIGSHIVYMTTWFEGSWSHWI